MFLDRNFKPDMYSSPSIIRMIKSRGLRLAGHVARMRRRTRMRRRMRRGRREEEYMWDTDGEVRKKEITI
jgi:hypothetical protein